MRRPPGLWILLSAGVVWLSLQGAYGLRATSLIFGKSTSTTTTTTTAKTASEESGSAEDETATTISADLSNDPNSTKPTLTGNPQIDYIWDPNLPKELNGYNLSDYPFYERVPEDIDFKCDGLHDGFYASVAHKCQVYHHCLFGTRYDFLCANYTAFDQKTFICHFASEVDCANSKKFWHRNDALYKSATTTTVKPFVIYTTAPPLTPSTYQEPAPLPPSSPGLRRPVGGRRRPFRRRRPQFDYYDDEYYDDYYEERPRSNRGRKRPKPRPRPVYEDEYDEDYEEDRYQRRGGSSRKGSERRPYDRTGSRRKNNERIKEEYDDEETEDGYEDEDYDLSVRRKPSDRKRRPLNDRIKDYEKPASRKGQRRPAKDDYEDDSALVDDSRDYERPRKNSDRRNKPADDTSSVIKLVSGSIYDRPRVAPRIKLPVPKSEAEKYAYKPVETQVSSTVQDDEEYYEDYEEEPTSTRKNIRKTQSNTRPRDRDGNSRKPTSSSSLRQRRPDPYEIEEESRPKTNKNRGRRPSNKEYYDDYEEEEEVLTPASERSSQKRTKLVPSTSTTTTTETPIERVEQPIVRLVKRPFLPSRGGNPYAARGLQPVGSKALTRKPDKVLGEDTVETEHKKEEPSPTSQVGINTESDKKPYQPHNSAGPRTTQKPKLPERNPLDVVEENYDVTLNDALYPTLPNMPIRASPASFNPENDYAFTDLQRPRYNSDPSQSPSSAEHVYQNKPLMHTFQPQREHFVQSNSEVVGQYSNYKPRQVQHQTEVYHHCLFGTRYDFLCANYTAFDQTLFNCNFASNVDCENSKKYWHRNDELYIEKSTTTIAPAINYNFYTPPPPPGSPLTPYPVDVSTVEAAPRRQSRPRATRPPARPAYDYYEDYELPRPINRKRPRPRPRPLYYDDYEEYEDLRIGRRGGGRRRPYSRRDRPSRRNKDRRKIEYDDIDYTYEDDDLVLGKKAKGKRRKIVEDYDYEEDRRSTKRRPQIRRDNNPPRKKIPTDDYYEFEDDETLNRRKLQEDRRPINDGSKKIPRLGKRRPPSEEYEDDLQQADSPQPYDRSRKYVKEKSLVKPLDDGRPIIKPVSGTIYDRPRVAPRINLPVPKNAANKFAYKPVGTVTTPVAKTQEEEYDDFEEVASQPATTGDKKPATSKLDTSKTRQGEESNLEVSKVNKEVMQDDYEDETSNVEKPRSKTIASTTTSTESAVDHSQMPVIRKFKRPFLPSRGGNPLSARNLQPVGTKAKEDAQEIDLGESLIMRSVADPSETTQNKEPNEDRKPLVTKVTLTTPGEESTLRSAFRETVKEEPKQGVIRIKVPIRVKPYPEQEDIDSQSPFRNKYSIPESISTTQSSKVAKEDVLNGNYDVTLNEAISPIISNIPVRGFGAYNPATDYSYKRFQRPTKYVILDPVVSPGSTYYVK